VNDDASAGRRPPPASSRTPNGLLPSGRLIGGPARAARRWGAVTAAPQRHPPTACARGRLARTPRSGGAAASAPSPAVRCCPARGGVGAPRGVPRVLAHRWGVQLQRCAEHCDRQQRQTCQRPPLRPQAQPTATPRSSCARGAALGHWESGRQSAVPAPFHLDCAIVTATAVRLMTCCAMLLLLLLFKREVDCQMQVDILGVHTCCSDHVCVIMEVAPAQQSVLDLRETIPMTTWDDTCNAAATTRHSVHCVCAAASCIPSSVVNYHPCANRYHMCNGATSGRSPHTDTRHDWDSSVGGTPLLSTQAYWVLALNLPSSRAVPSCGLSPAVSSRYVSTTTAH